MRRRFVVVVVALALTLAGAGALAGPKSAGVEDREIQAASVGVPVGLRSLRLAGADRYATAVEISKGAGWDQSNTFAVFLATGSNFPDALAVGPSTDGMGPLLLTTRDQLPAVTAQELQRLKPCMVIAVGGPPVISTAVIQKADTYTVDC